MESFMSSLKISQPVAGHDMRIGSGFTAKHLPEDAFQGLIDPVVMVDHFHMTSPTFQPHPHAGLSAVTYLFEDSTSPHVNYDSMGNHGPIHPGALHWFAAGRGAVHTEAADVPEIRSPGVRVRVVLGESRGVVSPATNQLPEPFTLLDGFVQPGARFEHVLPRGWGGLLYVLTGELGLSAGGEQRTLKAEHGRGLQLPAGSASAQETLQLQAQGPGALHFALLSGPALREPLVKQGPFVMNTVEQMQQAIRDFQAGKFGQLVMPS